jgi:hypothetical protein
MRHLNRDLDLERRRRAARRHQPGCHLGEPLAAVLKCKRRSNNPSLKRPGIPAAPE